MGYPWWSNGIGSRYAFYPGYGYGYSGIGRLGYYGYQSNYAYAPGGYYNDSGYVVNNDNNLQPIEAPSQEKLADSLDYAGQGEAAFAMGRYEDAANLWRHALVDDPTNGALVLLLAQAQFQLGNWDEAAGAVQQASRMLPEDNWGAVVSNYEELYSNKQDYTNQLKKLEQARNDDPESPSLRFLLGYHFGFLGYPKQSIREFDKALEVAPKDEVASKMREMMAAKLDEGSKSQAQAPSNRSTF